MEKNVIKKGMRNGQKRAKNENCQKVRKVRGMKKRNKRGETKLKE